MSDGAWADHEETVGGIPPGETCACGLPAVVRRWLREGKERSNEALCRECYDRISEEKC